MPPDKVLRVNLSSEVVESEPIPEEWQDRYVGGKGLGARYLYDELDVGVDPLGPENALVFAMGPLTGVLPGEQRYAAVTKSPLTGAFLDSYAGGEFPAVLAGALEDHLLVLVTGIADELTTLHIEAGDADLTPAPNLSGATTEEVDERFPDAAVACIGPAGENGVRYASIASDGGDHQAGRGGAGAVMGAKQLKAIAVRGTPPSTDRFEELKAESEETFVETAVGRWQSASETLESVDFADEIGGLATRGWQEGTFEGTPDIGIEAAREATTERERDDDAVPGGFRVEYEDDDTVPRGATQMTLGAGLGIDDFDAVAELGDVCDRLGMDVITAGNAVAFAVRASADGVLDREFSFGDPESAHALLREIATRGTPVGDALADGVEAAARRYDTEEYVPTVKAMELPSYDPRAAPTMMLAYATSDRGGCHRRARPVEREAVQAEGWTDADRVRAVVAEQDQRSALWCLVVDDFVGESFEALGAQWLTAAGLNVDPSDMAELGERVWNLTRLFNVREGFDRSADDIPDVLTDPLPDGPAEGAAIDPDQFDALLDRYYERRGWSSQGIPTRETLQRLGLDEAVDTGTFPPADDG